MGDRARLESAGGSSRAWPPMCSTLLTTFRATATLDFMPGTTSSTACGDGDCRGRGGQDPDSKVRSVFAAGHARSDANQAMPTGQLHVAPLHHKSARLRWLQDVHHT